MRDLIGNLRRLGWQIRWGSPIEAFGNDLIMGGLCETATRFLGLKTWVRLEPKALVLFLEKTYHIVMRAFLLLLLFLNMSVLPAQAQRRIKIKKPATNSSFVQRVVRWATLRPLTRIQRLRRSVVKIKETVPLPTKFHQFESSGFVIEVEYKGQKKLWGVSAAHYNLEKPALAVPGRLVPISFIAKGSSGLNDAVLFEIPEQYAQYWTPLQLSQDPLQVGQELHSLGFFKNAWHHEKGRIVKEITPHRVITSLQVDPDHTRAGACGGPILNTQDEVVGMHVGSSKRNQIGYMVPVQHIRDLISAYYRQDGSPQPLIFNGHNLGPIHINEHIDRVEVRERGRLIRSRDMYNDEKEIDYNHLEKLLSTQYGDEIIFTIVHHPFSDQAEDPKSYIITVSYDLENGEIVRTSEKDFSPFLLGFH